MATVKPSYSGAASALTITLASLATASYRQSTGIDNGTNLYVEAIITGKYKTGASGTVATGSITLYLVSYDGTQYSNNATGTDGSFTPDAQANLIPLWTGAAVANATQYYLPMIHIAAAAGLQALPQKWALVFLNSAGGALDSTAGNFAIEYQGLNLTVA